MADRMDNKLEIGDLSRITTYQAGALLSAAQRVLRMHTDNILSPYGITKTQWMVIGMTLDAGSEGVRLTEINSQLDLKPNSLAPIISSLEKQNMVMSINKGKQRAIVIHPTFAQDCPEIERILRRALRTTIYTAVTPMEFRVYLKVLFQLSRMRPDWPREN